MRRILFTMLTLAIALTGATAAGAAEKLTADDHAEIQQLYVQYARAIDSGDAMAWAKTFTDDGVFGDSVGHDALVAFAQGFHQNFQGRARHWNDAIQITATEEGADGSCYLTLYNTGTNPPSRGRHRHLQRQAGSDGGRLAVQDAGGHPRSPGGTVGSPLRTVSRVVTSGRTGRASGAGCSSGSADPGGRQCPGREIRESDLGKCLQTLKQCRE